MKNAAIRKLVRERASDCCEYCGLRQSALPLATFHIEHVIARQHGGSDDPANLALACHHCNMHKGPNLTGIDPITGLVVPLFNPRRDRWDEHFHYAGVVTIGVTSIGRATVRVLAMNSAEQRDARSNR